MEEEFFDSALDFNWGVIGSNHSRITGGPERICVVFFSLFSERGENRLK
jgi:hypothetical protein